MKKMTMMICMMMVAMLFVSTGTAMAQGTASDQSFPKLVGNNVEYPAAKLEANTPGWKPGMKFYTAIDKNRWDPQEGDTQFEMKKVGNKYVAQNVINKRHHPVLAPRVWFKIEDAYPQYLPKKGEFANSIDYTNPDGPCFCFGPKCVPFNQGGK